MQRNATERLVAAGGLKGPAQSRATVPRGRDDGVHRGEMGAGCRRLGADSPPRQSAASHADETLAVAVDELHRRIRWETRPPRRLADASLGPNAYTAWSKERSGRARWPPHYPEYAVIRASFGGVRQPMAGGSTGSTAATKPALRGTGSQYGSIANARD